MKMDEVLAVSAAALDEIIAEKLAAFEADLMDRGFDPDHAAAEIERQRRGIAAWRAAALADLPGLLERGGGALH